MINSNKQAFRTLLSPDPGIRSESHDMRETLFLGLALGYEGFKALASGERHKLYYTPRGRLLLSIEPAGDLAAAAEEVLPSLPRQ